MSTRNMRRRLDRLMTQQQAIIEIPGYDLSLLDEGEVAHLGKMEAKAQRLDGEWDLSTLTDEELNELERIIARVTPSPSK